MTDANWPNRYWGAASPPTAKSNFFTAAVGSSPEGSNDIATIRLYGPIDSWGGWWGVSAKDVALILDQLPASVSRIILRINSQGGEVFEALAILNMLRAHRAATTAVVDGMAASAASVIAASCDETVMSPGTMMMIHAPSSIAWGTAADMRETADFLDIIETSLIEIYEGKAGAKDWRALLAKDTWLTTAAALELGLVDRVAIIPDAGEADTAGIDVDALLEAIDPDGDDDLYDSAVTAPAAITPSGVQAVAPTLPSSTEPGHPTREENAVAYSDLKAGLRERLGVKDADPSDETLLDAVDEALNERAEEPAPAAAVRLPEGVVAIEAGVLTQLQADAAEGARARAEQVSARRDEVIASAVRDGRIAPASSTAFRALLDKDEEGTTATLATLPSNGALPVAEIGRSDKLTDGDDALYASAFGGDAKAS